MLQNGDQKTDGLLNTEVILATVPNAEPRRSSAYRPIIEGVEEPEIAVMDDAANPERYEDEEMIELIFLLDRNWAMISFYTVVGGTLGFIIYLFTGWLEFVWALLMASFLVACLVDYVWGERKKQLKLLNIVPVNELVEGTMSSFNEGKDDKSRFYVRSDFYHYWWDSLYWRFRKYYIGTTIISVVGDAMTIRFKGVDRVFGYKGFEIGTVIGFLVANIFFCR